MDLFGIRYYYPFLFPYVLLPFVSSPLPSCIPLRSANWLLYLLVDLIVYREEKSRGRKRRVEG